jgi:hypothetical protein
VKDFKDTRQAQFERMTRHAIRKSEDLTKSERDVTIALVNIWFFHQAKGRICPGRKKLAKKAMVTEKTVSRTLGKLRDIGGIVPLTPLKGNRYKATEYWVDIEAILVFCRCDWVNTFRMNVPSRILRMSHLARDKMSHRSFDVASYEKKNPNQDIETFGGEHE